MSFFILKTKPSLVRAATPPPPQKDGQCCFLIFKARGLGHNMPDSLDHLRSIHNPSCPAPDLAGSQTSIMARPQASLRKDHHPKTCNEDESPWKERAITPHRSTPPSVGHPRPFPRTPFESPATTPRSVRRRHDDKWTDDPSVPDLRCAARSARPTEHLQEDDDQAPPRIPRKDLRPRAERRETTCCIRSDYPFSLQGERVSTTRLAWDPLPSSFGPGAGDPRR